MDEPPRPSSCGSDDFANFSLRHQAYVEREFRQASANQAQQRRSLGKTIALRVPRQVRNAERKFAREPFDDRGSIGAERRQRSRRATELDDENSGRGLIQSLDVRDQWRRPHRALEAERGRDRVLKMSAAGNRRVAKLCGSISERARERDQVAPHDCKRAPQLQDERGIEDVLSGRAKMDVARGFVACDSAQLLHQRDDGIADAARALGDVVEPQVLDPSGAADRVGDGRRHQADFRFRAGEGGLDVEHELQMSTIGKEIADFVGAVESAENLRVGRMNAHTSKNTVSFSPCSTMSKRNTPFSIRATSVARRSGATVFSTASVAFSGSPGK